MAEVRIEIPQYIQEIRLAEKKAKKYYKRQDSTIPDKFLLDPTPGTALNTSRTLKHPYLWNKGKIFNLDTREFILRNPSSAGKPRIKFIAGNDIYEGARFQRQKIVEAIKENMSKYMPVTLSLKFPITVEAEFHVDPRFANWDIGNLWIYDKVFEDVLQDHNLIPNDNILYITKSGGAQYVPIVNNEERKLIFILREETDPRVLSHVMYDLKNIKEYQYISDKFDTGDNEAIFINLITTGKPGDILFDEPIVNISIGRKKIIWGAVRKGLASVFSLAVQQNAHVVVTKKDFLMFNTFIEEELRLRGLTVLVYEGGDDIHGNSQNAPDQVQT